jgi:hypothetical protein
MSRSVPILATVLVLLGGVPSGCGDGGSTPDAPATIDALPPDAPPRQTIMEGVLLVPTELAEGVMTGGNGDLAAIHLTAPIAELDWNIHGHANGGTQVIYEEFDRTTVQYVFAPAAHADWYLLIRNSGPTDMTVQVKIELYGNMQWRWE